MSLVIQDEFSMMKFMRCVKLAVILLVTMATFSSCYCPRKKIESIGHCAFRLQCIGAIRGVTLPKECLGSTNYDVSIELTLTDAVERFDSRIELDTLAQVTKLEASGVWPQTSLSILQYMPKLKNLYLVGNSINHIAGAPFYHLDLLQNVDLSRNNLTDLQELFHFEAQPNQMRKLSLAYNAIRVIPGDAFEELTSLVELDLSGNYLTDLNEEPFSNLTSLEVLRLNNNRIKQLNGAVNNLLSLKHLYLRGNDVENIDEQSLKIIYHLETFDMSGNQLDILKPIVFMRHWNHIGEGRSVCKILLSENQITLLPNATSTEIASRFVRDVTLNNTIAKNNVDVLTELDLSKNEINFIQYNAFRTIFRLVSLDLSNNKLVNFSVNANDLSHVKRLNLSNNLLDSIYYENFYRMVELQNLDLSNNVLTTIPDKTFANNHNLRILNMNNNNVKELDNLHIEMFHNDGGVLDLSNNKISRLFISLGDGLHLNKLILHDNNISDASNVDLIYHTELQSLELNNNIISELNASCLRLPVTLVNLDLSGNRLTKISPSTFERLGHLKTLRLGSNQLHNLEFGVFKGLSSLWNLDLSYNGVKQLDSKVFMDLKSLRVLFLRYNGMYYMDYAVWLGHKNDLVVYVDGNSFSCEWLGTALTGFNNGYSKMRPAVLMRAESGHSLEGVPCIPKKVAEYVEPQAVMVDERLLVTNQKILEALREQTYFLKKYLWHSIQLQSRPN